MNIGIRVFLGSFAFVVTAIFNQIYRLESEQRYDDAMNEAIFWILFIVFIPELARLCIWFFRLIFRNSSADGKRFDNLSNKEFREKIMERVIQMGEQNGIEVNFSYLREASQDGLYYISAAVHTFAFDVHEKRTGEQFAVSFAMLEAKKGPCKLEIAWDPDYDDPLNSCVGASTIELSSWLFDEISGWNDDVTDMNNAALSSGEQLGLVSGLEVSQSSF